MDVWSVDTEALLQSDDDADAIGRLATVSCTLFTTVSHYIVQYKCTIQMLQMHVHRHIATATQKCYWASNETFTN